MSPRSAGLFLHGQRWRVAVVDAHGAALQSFWVPCANTSLALVRAFWKMGVREVVLEDREPPGEPLAEIATDAGIDAWMAPRALVTALAQAAGHRTIRPREHAALLARLPGIPAWRAQLRLFEMVPPDMSAQQIPLF